MLQVNNPPAEYGMVAQDSLLERATVIASSPVSAHVYNHPPSLNTATLLLIPHTRPPPGILWQV